MRNRTALIVLTQLTHDQKMKVIATTMVHERLHHDNPSWSNPVVDAAARACVG
jgi:hypothetical protein